MPTPPAKSYQRTLLTHRISHSRTVAWLAASDIKGSTALDRSSILALPVNLTKNVISVHHVRLTIRHWQKLLDRNSSARHNLTTQHIRTWHIISAAHFPKGSTMTHTAYHQCSILAGLTILLVNTEIHRHSTLTSLVNSDIHGISSAQLISGCTSTDMPGYRARTNVLSHATHTNTAHTQTCLHIAHAKRYLHIAHVKT